jgi:hypothetical protein
MELMELEARREDVSIATPVTLVSIGAGAFLTSLAIASSSGSASGDFMVSPVAAAFFLTSALITVPGLSVLVARLYQRSILSGHIRDVQRELARGEARDGQGGSERRVSHLCRLEWSRTYEAGTWRTQSGGQAQ